MPRETFAAGLALLLAVLAGAGLLWAARNVHLSDQEFVERAWPTRAG